MEEMDESSTLEKMRHKIWTQQQMFYDKIIIYPLGRWLFVLLLFIIYIIRAWQLNGNNIYNTYLGYPLVSYFLAIYLLEAFLGFVSPKDEDEFEEQRNKTILPMR